MSAETQRAFALVAEIADAVQSGRGEATTTLAGGQVYDVGKAAGSKNLIVLDTEKDGPKISALDNYWAVKSVPVPAGRGRRSNAAAPKSKARRSRRGGAGRKPANASGESKPASSAESRSAGGNGQTSTAGKE